MSSNLIDNLMLQLAFEKPKRYTYDELKEYTSNFKKNIGAGAFGNVYLGKFPNGVEIAVKVLKVNDVVESMFEAEVLTMGKTCHRHLVKLFGFCYDASNKALVYEYLKKGSLDNLLYKNCNEVEWSTLFKIAVEMGQALAYLHHGCTYQIIHHDVKAANVLLDADYSPRVTDFGLAKLMSRDETHQTMISGKGTRGYAAPEVWSPFSHVTFKCDVYSFGMVLFEVLGRRINNEGKNWFPMKVWNAFENNKLDDLIVGCGIKEKDRENAKILTLVAFWCVQHTPGTRPTMSTVATVLENEIVVNVPPNPFLVSDHSKFQMQPKAEISFSSVNRAGKNPSHLHDDARTIRMMSSNSIDNQNLMLQLACVKPKRYTYNELKEYTSNFKKKIGAGAFGDVYLGKFPNGLEIAVKVLNMNNVVESVFEAEVLTMCKTYHRHLVKIFGFCYDASNKVLVYQYLKSGSLDMLLYHKGSEVEWPILYKIAVEMGQALAYLHQGCTYQIIHHDVKAANVLLDADYSPRVTDFGLANLMSRDEAYQTLISGQGTRGYTAPEVSSSFSHVTFKCDVYSFGMVLFEVLGRRTNSEGKSWFPMKVWNAFENNKFDDLIVGCGIKEKDRRKAKILAFVAFWCAQHTPETRPTMSTVVTVLAKEIQVNVPPNPFFHSDPKRFQMKPANDLEAEFSAIDPEAEFSFEV